MNRLNRWLCLALILICGCLVGILGFSIWDKVPSTIEPVAWSPQVQWVGPSEPNYRFYLRRSFDLPNKAQTAWLRISADNDFILNVNGKVVSHEITYYSRIPRNTLGLVARRSDPYQGFNDSYPYYFVPGDCIQVAFAKDWRLTTYVDLTPYLKPGRNLIALEVQKSTENPRVAVEGMVYAVSSLSPINLTTGESPWRVSIHGENRREVKWSDPEFPDQSWPEAQTLGPVKEATYSFVSKHLFERPLEGNWITGIDTPQGEVWLRGSWEIAKKRQRSFIRYAGEGDYGLMVNGTLVQQDNSQQLHMQDVTNLVHTGLNTIAVRLARPLDRDWSTYGRGNLTPNGAIGFFLDGWVETAQGDITGTIATGSDWTTLPKPVPGWSKGNGQGQAAIFLRSIRPEQFQRKFEGNAYLLNYPDYLLHQGIWCLGGIVCIWVYALILGWYGSNDRNNWWNIFATGAALLLPGTLFLIDIGLLKHRFAEAEKALLFSLSQSNSIILLGFVSIVLLTLLYYQLRRRKGKVLIWIYWSLLGLFSILVSALLAGGIVLVPIFLGSGVIANQILGNCTNFNKQKWQYNYKLLAKIYSTWGKWLVLGVIVLIGFALRTYKLGFIDLEPDENVSFDAIRGILRTGAPIAVSDIWYTRGPFFHYLLAAWMKIVGESYINGRFMSVIWGTATLVVVFIIARNLTGKIWISLIVTALIAIDPWELWYSRNLRFYQVTQCLYLLCFFGFFKGFIEKSGRWYQYIYLITLTLALISQEVTMTLIPALVIGCVFFYRPLNLLANWQLIIGGGVMGMVFVYNAIFFKVKCLTPLIGLSSATVGHLHLHLSNVSFFTNKVFVGFNRMNTIHALFLFIGLIFFIWQRNGKSVFVGASIIINVIFVSILVTLTGSRYAYSFYPLFILFSVYSILSIALFLSNRFNQILNNQLPLKSIVLFFVIMLLAFNIETDRILNSYSESLTPRHIQISQYIVDHFQPGDVVICNVPSVHANVLNGADYYVPHRMSFFDAVYWNDGRLIGRWEGRSALVNVDQFSHVIEKHNRIWIHLLHQPQLPKDSELAQFYDLLQTTGKPILDTFGANLRLWEKDDGLLQRVPNRGRDLGPY
ncbi:MAG: glycosyl transferase [Moorea sp. SIO3C2]|nr:glycosyl transferase [Moorena sp. SIO3C2]